ncbi:hypothetical protein PI126_g17760 [Phytophthora idaei]|nr:hypothetical protein PI126_g17760 [Phytophthora idaei]
MQQQPVHLTLFDLSNSTDWEYVFLSAAERKSAKEGDQGAKGGVDLSDDLKMLSTEGDDHHGVDAGEEDDLILDIPPSWVTKLHIDRATYKNRFVKDCQHFTMTRDWNKGMTFLESAHATVIPFGFDETCHALSTALLTSSSGDIYSDGIVDPENTRAFKCHLDFSQELGSSATLILHTVTRRCVEAGRVVFSNRR